MVKMTVPEVLIREKGKGGRFFMLRGSYPFSPAARKKKEIPQYIGVKKLRFSPLPPFLSSTVFMVMAENYNAQTSSSSSFLHLSCQRYFFVSLLLPFLSLPRRKKRRKNS